MPVQDDSGKAVGSLLYEDTTSGNYVMRFITICFTSQKMKLYPAEAKNTEDLSKFEVISEIRCQYITKVGPSSARPKVLNCLEIVTTGVIHRFAVDSVEERDEWIEVIKQSSMRQGSFRNVTQRNKERAGKDISYKTQVVGGVIRKIPIQKEPTEDSERNDLTSSGPACIGASAIDVETIKEEKKKKIYKAGYATKCGAVMKSWKRRFFIVTEESFGYYKSHEETEPIRSIPVSELSSVGKSKERSAKEHLLEVATPQRIFYIQGDNEDEMKEWILGFQSVINSRRTTMTLPVTSKERSNSQERNLDLPVDQQPSSPTSIQDYESSPNLIKKTTTSTSSMGQCHDDGGNDDTDDDNDDDDLSLGTKV